jgi:hypothetical protein
MNKLDQKIEKIKLTRMKSDEKFIYNILKTLQKEEINNVWYFHDGIHSFSYMKYRNGDNRLFYNGSLFLSLMYEDVTLKTNILLINELQNLLLNMTNNYYNLDFKYIITY